MRRSWLDWLLDTIDRIPGPRGAVYTGALVVWVAFVGIGGYLDQAIEAPWVSPGMALGVVLGLATLWAMQTLNGAAARAMTTLEPLLTVDADERARLYDAIARTPPMWALVALIVGAISGIDSVLTTPVSWGVPSGDAPWSMALGLTLGVFNTTMLMVFVARLLHQVRVIDEMHREAVRVDLARLEPLYGFSSYVARAAITLIVVSIGGLTALAAFLGSFFEFATSDYILFGSLLGVTVIAFVVPTRGLHDRISDEKDARLGDAHADAAAVRAELARRIAAGDYEGAGRLNDAISATDATAVSISRISTWPWRPETLRGFVSAVLLPIALWFVVTFLGRVIPT